MYRHHNEIHINILVCNKNHFVDKVKLIMSSLYNGYINDEQYCSK